MQFAPKYVFTRTQDAEIRRVYEIRERGGNTRLAAKFGVSPSLISARAAQLELPPLQRTNNRNSPVAWKAAELKIVEQCLSQPTIAIRAALAKHGYHRDCGAIISLIYRKRARHEWPSLADQADDRDSYLVQDLVAGLGMSRDQIQSWITKGWLRASKFRSGSAGCWLIRRRDVRRALRTYAAHWDHRQADKWFLLDVLCDDDHSIKIQHSAGVKDSGIGEARYAV